jgi:uncharacterized protein (DUF58 family)
MSATRPPAASEQPTVPAVPAPGARVHRRYPVSFVFIIYAFVTLLVAVGAFNANNNLLFWLFGLALGLMLVSGVISGTMMMGLRVHRDGFEQPVEGQPLRVRYRVSNSSRVVPTFAVSIREVPVPAVPAGSEGRPVERASVMAEAPAAHVVHVPRGASVTAEGLARPATRGLLRLGAYEVGTGFPFGIIRKALYIEAPTSVIVHPGHAEVPADLLDVIAGRGAIGSSNRSRSRGGDEIVGLREYQPGDPLRSISWRASARQPGGGLMVKQTASGTPRRLWVLLTLSASAESGSRELAISRAASVLRAGAQSRLSVSLTVLTDWGHQLDVPAGTPGARPTTLLNELALIPDPPAGAAGSAQGTPVPSRPASMGDIVVSVDTRGELRVLGRAGAGGRAPVGAGGRA